jgi:hypothetical protein
VNSDCAMLLGTFGGSDRIQNRPRKQCSGRDLGASFRKTDREASASRALRSWPMALAFKVFSQPIDVGTGQRDIPVQVPMGQNVKTAEVAIKAFNLDFVDPTDRVIDIVRVMTTRATASGDEVVFNIICQYADRNGNERYKGSVDVLVIAEV